MFCLYHSQKKRNSIYLNLRDIRYRGFLGSLNRWYGWCRPVHDEQIHRWGFSKKDLEAYITEACNFFSIPKFFNKKNIWDTYEVFEMKQADKNSVNKKIKGENKNKINNRIKIKSVNLTSI